MDATSATAVTSTQVQRTTVVRTVTSTAYQTQVITNTQTNPGRTITSTDRQVTTVTQTAPGTTRTVTAPASASSWCARPRSCPRRWSPP